MERSPGYPTAFQQVSAINELWGNARGNPAKGVNWDRLLKQVSNIAGTKPIGGKVEFDEVLEAISTRDVTAARDALCDVAVFVLGAYHMLGCDFDEDIGEVVRALNSRFCRDEQHLKETVAHYREVEGLHVTYTLGYPRAVVKSAQDQTGKSGAYYPANKLLKALGHEEPTFRPV